MEFSNSLLQKYRNDRRKLLEFLLSSGLIKEIKTPAGLTTSVSKIDFDSLSIDYVLECIKSGGLLDFSLARKGCYDESSLPAMVHLQSGDIFYLHSDPDSAGSPPRRGPPVITKQHHPNRSSYLAGEPLPLSGHEIGVNYQVSSSPNLSPMHNTDILTVGLPMLRTGLVDDDLREFAYEVLLACMLFSGLEIHLIDGKKREKGSRFLAGLKNKKDKRHLQSESPDRHLKVLETIRLQMQVSEATNTFVKRRLTQFASGKPWGQLDVPQLSLALLTGILKSDFPSEKSYMHWKNRQANILEELLFSDYKKTEKQIIGTSLEKVRDPKEWDVKMSPSERSEVLLTIRQVALMFSTIPARFGIEGETYYWTTGYHLNIRLYEKLLFGVFDILEDGQIIEEADEILKLVKLTWSMLGITHRLHHVLFALVLFQQFVATEEVTLLDYAILEVEKVLSAEDSDEKEVAYMTSLLCFTGRNECEIRLNLLQSIFLSISSWCDSKLRDYHLHFSQKPLCFERVMTMGLSVGIQDFDSHGNVQFKESLPSSEIVAAKVKTYVERSLAAACERVDHVTNTSSVGSIKDKIHPLATLASELRLIAEKDLSIFFPVLCQWYPECAMVSAKRLHQFYGEKLKPFLKDVTCLTEDVRKVLAAADALEHCLIKLYSSACTERELHFLYGQEFDHYQIAEISRSIILDWVVAQHERILEWTGRAFDLEDWEPLSSQQKQAASAVEVFRIIDETVDQFFEMSLPLDITHLQALLSIIFHCLDAYLLKVVSQLVDKKNLYPSTPPLTRYTETTFPIVKKKLAECLILDVEINKKLNVLTTSKLCIRLNTFRYIQKQTAILEDGIRKSWESVRVYKNNRCSKEQTTETLETTLDSNNESVAELFVATLECIRDSASDAIRQTCDFLGARFVFLDLRDSFLFHLYRGGVEGNRLDGILPQFDGALNTVCGLIDDTIRDLVVSSIFKASMEGFVWVLLDGGPSRAFSDPDISMIEEDLKILKDLFVADGEGLPRYLVEEEAKFSHQILSLFSLQTESVIQMLMTSSEHISVGANGRNYGQRYLGDAHTLIRVLCHKKDREASKFLKRHYQLPSSSEYDENPQEDFSVSSPLVADLIKRSASFRWSEKGNFLVE
ncbi:hypothetical protein Fot_13302 [Forsythia ovata]|uniref:Uncharacterized protein n=1 Tax=Forsythia ovata TaxID=205694 RepID=A0ABD1W343_9LAMI